MYKKEKVSVIDLFLGCLRESKEIGSHIQEIRKDKGQ